MLFLLQRAFVFIWIVGDISSIGGKAVSSHSFNPHTVFFFTELTNKTVSSQTVGKMHFKVKCNVKHAKLNSSDPFTTTVEPWNVTTLVI